MNALKKLDAWLAKTESGVLVTILFLMVFLAISQVILRNLLNQGFLWSDLLLRQLVLWVGFLGASLAVRERRHISIDVLPQLVPARFKPFIEILKRLTAGLISIWLCVAALKFVQMEIEFPTILFLGIPAWVFQLILPFSFAVISLRYFLQVLDDSLKLWQKE